MPDEIGLPLDAVEVAQLEALAAQNGMTVEQVAKLILRRELDRIPRLLLDDDVKSPQ